MRSRGNARRTRRLPILVVATALVAAALALVAPRPASAAIVTPICSSGTSDWICEYNSNHYTDNGYGAASGSEYWSEYSGHNCTNYVAYMEIQNGAPSGYAPGDADAWESYFTSSSHGSYSFDGTPQVAAVAWWTDASWNSYDGHVAYVEAVNTDSSGNVQSIAVSEDNYGGVFDWAVIPVGDSIYPKGNSTSGFIHIADVPTVSMEPSASPNQNDLYEKSNPNSTWTEMSNSVTAGYWKMAGNYFWRYDSSSGFWIKVGINGTWTNISNTVNISEWDISQGMIAFQTGSAPNGELYHETTPSGPLVDDGSATNGYWKIAGSRIAKWNGTSGLYVADGEGSMTNVADATISAWDISANLIAKEVGSTLYVEPKAGAGWSTVSGGVTAGYWYLAGERIAKWDGSSGLWVIDLSYASPSWVNEASTSTTTWSSCSVSSEMIAVLVTSNGSTGTLEHKWLLNDSWVTDSAATNGYWGTSGNQVYLWNGGLGLYVATADNPMVNVTGTSTSAWSVGPQDW